MITVRKASPRLAEAQAEWIAGMDPWLSLGFRADGLARFLRRSAGGAGHDVLVAGEGSRGPVLGIACLQDGVLLGRFVALLAVRGQAAGKGVGRTLMEAVEQQTFATRGWLFVSVDAENRGARAFYRKLGFKPVGRLPDLIRPGRVEILLRKPAPASPPRAPGAAPRPGRRRPSRGAT